MSLPVRLLRLPHAADLPVPAYHSPGAAGVDLQAALPDHTVMVLEPGARDRVPTGLVLELPDGFEAQIRPRSGLALRHGVTVLNAPGTVDADYRGELLVLLVNLGQEPFPIRRGDRIAQLVVARVERVRFEEAEALAGTVRGPAASGRPGPRAPRRPPPPAETMLSRRTRFAIEAVTDLARLACGQPVPARALASAGGLPPRQFEAVLQDLVRAGLLRSVRGVRGGYELARERRRISLGSIVRAVDPPPDPAPDRPVELALARAREAYLAALDEVSLEAISRETGRATAAADFEI